MDKLNVIVITLLLVGIYYSLRQIRMKLGCKVSWWWF